jgi:hypothetical protein
MPSVFPPGVQLHYLNLRNSAVSGNPRHWKRSVFPEHCIQVVQVRQRVCPIKAKLAADVMDGVACRLEILLKRQSISGVKLFEKDPLEWLEVDSKNFYPVFPRLESNLIYQDT